MNTTYLTYPDWMQEALRVNNERLAEMEEQRRIKAELLAAEQRALGKALPEALAFFDIAIPAQETNRAELDFVAFSLRDFDFEPVRRDENGVVMRYCFMLKAELLCGPDSGMVRSVLVVADGGEVDAIKQARREFAQIVVDFHHRAALHKAAAMMVIALGPLNDTIYPALAHMKDVYEPGATPEEFARETPVAAFVAAFLEWVITEDFYEAAKWVEAALEAMLNAPEQAVEEVA